LQLRVDLREVLVDAIQVEQVLVNLVRNSAEAMARAAPARRALTLVTEAGDGDAALVRVIDTGPGVPEATRAHLFDAFYTTKPDGLGMGLSISRSIVEAHGGHIRALANADGGLTVEFSLPFAPEETRE
jgi:signal transduction histidine kinase